MITLNSSPLLHSEGHALSPLLSGGDDLQKGPESPELTNDDKLRTVASEFEQLIFRQMFRPIQKPSFGQGFLAEEGSHSPYSEMVIQQLSNSLASTASLGIASSLHAQLLSPDPTEDTPGDTTRNPNQLL